MPIRKREYNVLPTHLMTDVDSTYMRDVVSTSGVDLNELSLEMGYNRLYLYTCLYDGRICRDYLEMLSEIIGFSVEKALIKKRKPKKRK